MTVDEWFRKVKQLNKRKKWATLAEVVMATKVVEELVLEVEAVEEKVIDCVSPVIAEE